MKKKEKIKVSILTLDEEFGWVEEDIIYTYANWEELIKYLDKMPFPYTREEEWDELTTKQK